MGHNTRKCTCTLQAIRRYQAKLSGPFLDRIDLHIPVQPVDLGQLRNGESSQVIRGRVQTARQLQQARNPEVDCNAMMNTAMIRQFCPISKTNETVLHEAITQYKLSARAYERILKVARTIADLASAPNIELEHLAEAIAYRANSTSISS